MVEKTRPLPNFKIDCATCENYGSFHCSKELPDSAIAAGKRQIQSATEPKMVRFAGDPLGGDYITVEFCQQAGAAYIDASFESDSVTVKKDGSLTIFNLPDGLHLPFNLTKDHWPSFYVSPENIAMLESQRGVSNYRLKDLQQLVWVRSQQDGNLYMFREKDLSPSGGMRRYQYLSKSRLCKDCNGKGSVAIEPGLFHTLTSMGTSVGRTVCPFCKDGMTVPRHQGPNTPIRIKYQVQDIWQYLSHPQGMTVNIHGIKGSSKGHWERIGSLSDEQAMARKNEGPAVQPGTLTTVSLIEDLDGNDQDWDCLDDSENFRLEEVA